MTQAPSHNPATQPYSPFYEVATQQRRKAVELGLMQPAVAKQKRRKVRSREADAMSARFPAIAHSSLISDIGVSLPIPPGIAAAAIRC